MANGLNENLSEVVSLISPQVAGGLDGLITILKAIGIVFVIYLIYSIIMAIVNIRRMRILGRIEKRMDSLEEKINALVENPKKERSNKKKK